jgi:hypothetical protein
MYFQPPNANKLFTIVQTLKGINLSIHILLVVKRNYVVHMEQSLNPKKDKDNIIQLCIILFNKV